MKAAILLSFLLFSIASRSQAPDWSWARTAGSLNSNEWGRAIATDYSGNSYVAGNIQNPAMFGSINVGNPWNGSVFIAKYDSAGNVVWAFTTGGNTQLYVEGISLDGNGNFYVGGDFYGTAYIGDDTVTAVGWPSFGSSDVFLAKYDTAGNFIWVRTGGGWNSESGWAIAANGFNEVFITGSYQNTAYFGSDSITSTSSIDIFTAKYDDSGNLIWIKSAGGATYDIAHGIASDKFGNCFVTGRFQDTCYFGNLSVVSNGDYDVFVVKYDAAGNALWVRSGGGANFDMGNDIETDPDGNCYITGEYAGGVTFDNIVLFGFGSYDIFTAKYDASGNLSWAQRAGGAGSDAGIDVAVDNSGNCFVGGAFYAPSADFSGTSVSSFGSHDLFVTKYDTDGELQWVQTAGGWVYDEAWAVSIDGSSNCYVTGRYYTGPSSFGNEIINSIGGEDIFVAKLSNTSIGSGVQWMMSDNYVTVFPNPFTTTATISINQPGKYDFMLYDVYGREVEILKSQILKCEIGRNNLPAGVYFYKVEDDTKVIGSGKVVIK